MKTKLEPRGINISVSEVSNVSALGFWLLVDDREYFVPLADYPAFKKATIPQIFNVKRIGPRLALTLARY